MSSSKPWLLKKLSINCHKCLTPLCCAVHIQVAKGQYIEGLILKYGFVAAARRTGGAAAAGPNSAVRSERSYLLLLALVEPSTAAAAIYPSSI